MIAVARLGHVVGPRTLVLVHHLRRLAHADQPHAMQALLFLLRSHHQCAAIDAGDGFDGVKTEHAQIGK